MQPHEKSEAICRQAGINIRERVFPFAFSPFLNSEYGIAATQLTFQAVNSDGSPSVFADFLLRHSDDHRVLKRAQGQGTVIYHLGRTGEPPPLELLVGIPAGVAAIRLTAEDEFSRTTSTTWPPDGSPLMKPLNTNPYPVASRLLCCSHRVERSYQPCTITRRSAGNLSYNTRVEHKHGPST